MLVYILWLVVFVWLPLSVLWIIYRCLVWNHKKTLIVCVIGALLFGIPWEIYAIGSGVWYFLPSSILGIYFLNIPIEEILFIVFTTLLISTIILILKQYRFFITKTKRLAR